MTDGDPRAENGPGAPARVRLRTREELVAVVPHVLGFHPHDSMVVMSVGGRGPTLRVDHPHTAEDVAAAAEAVVEPFRRHGYGRGGVAVVHFTDDQVHARALTGELVAGLVQAGVTPLVAVRTYDDWIVDLTTGGEEPVRAETRTRMAAESAYVGKAPPRGSREDLAAELVGDRAVQDAVLRFSAAAVRRFDGMIGPEAVGNEWRWMTESIAGFLAAGTPLRDVDAARMLVDLCHPRLRDVATAAITRETASAHVALWSDLTRRAPEPVREQPLAMVALSAWVSGDGAMAWTAVDASGGRHGLAQVTRRALESGLPPSSWDAVRQQYFAQHPDHPAAEATVARSPRASRPLRRHPEPPPPAGSRRHGPTRPPSPRGPAI